MEIIDIVFCETLIIIALIWYKLIQAKKKLMEEDDWNGF